MSKKCDPEAKFYKRNGVCDVCDRSIHGFFDVDGDKICRECAESLVQTIEDITEEILGMTTLQEGGR